MAANVTRIDGRLIYVILKGDVAWDWKSSVERGQAPELNDLYRLGHLYIQNMTFNPGSASDAVCVREGGASGAPIFNVSCASANDQKAQYFGGQRYDPTIATADVTSASDDAVLVIELA